jgi:hypothetical protein
MRRSESVSSVRTFLSTKISIPSSQSHPDPADDSWPHPGLSSSHGVEIASPQTCSAPTAAHEEAGRQPASRARQPRLRFDSTPRTRFHGMATTAMMIWIPAFAFAIPSSHRPPFAHPGATSAARLGTLPRCRPTLFSSCCTFASPSSGRPASSSGAALKRGSANFMDPARSATLQQLPPSSSDLRRGLIVPSAGTGGASAASGPLGPLGPVSGTYMLLA